MEAPVATNPPPAERRPAAPRRAPRLSQQAIVFALFIVLFLGLSVFLRGFFTLENLLTLVQNVAVLGILGLAMGMVVIGRGVDLALVASLAVPPGIVLQMV